MKLSEWARYNGIHYQTAYRWFREGRLPVPARKLMSGTILVEPERITGGVALYARVCSSDQKGDLERQLGRLIEWASKQGISVTHAITEIGSGMNGSRPKLRKLLGDPKVETIVVEHRDRLARLGSEYIEACLIGAGRRLIVVDATELEDDLVRDMTEVLTSLCARLYGRRSAKARADRAMRCAAEEAE